MSPRVAGGRRGRSGGRRAALGAAAVVVVAAGLAAHRLGWGPVADGCYTALLYLLIAVALPRVRPIAVGASAVLLSAAVELFQLTPVPAELSARFTLARLALGTSFDALDLLWYLAGGVIAAAADAVLRARADRRALPTRPASRERVDRPVRMDRTDRPGETR
ncbi:ribosomal maturation YjgA family protein [Mycetocola reblochoni]|uniref:Integral membrane protein n=1 Tax=Mycetocola reblochoni REB411 TaxID=1255698 RepID=A0A1R4ILJ2_9MICO|nr:DUF2809 domain-containing protein [Mycetocola reblochoni]SJN20123.1 integral membrane protein [Mycetocola reblochoni REB411]